METVKEKDSILLSVEAMNQLSRLRDLMVTAGCKGPEIEIRLMRILIDFISQGIGIAPSKLKESVLWQEEIPERTFPAAYTEVLAQCGELDWERISPAIFGAMFQQIMNQNRRREWGAYYTTEENILRVIRPLFLDDLEEQYRQCAGNKKRLKALLNQLGKLAFLDPACGCGNFLIIAYEKLRELEEKVIRAVWGTEGQSVDVGAYRQVTPAQFYGIEYEPFQAEIARLGLWMADIQMNGRLLQEDGHQSIPESGQATIVCADALTADWNEILPAGRCSFIMGNPPFVGARLMNREQKQDMRQVFFDTPGVGDLDYVAAWYRKSAEYMVSVNREQGAKAPAIRAAFVSTNSISQGKQAGILWRQLTYDFFMQIQFAVRSFVWNKEDDEDAKVHCVIIGFSKANDSPKRIFEGDKVRYTAHINGYLVPGPDLYVTARREPLSAVAPMNFGSMPNDGGHLLLSPEQMRELLEQSPEAEPWIQPFIGSEDFIRGKERYCLWLAGVSEEKWRRVPQVADRVEAVKRYRLMSPRADTRALADTPELFGEIRQPDKPYLIVPRVSSCNRPYIPVGFAPAHWIASDSVMAVPDGSLALFGVLMSSMHMAWVRTVGGRLKSDYRYSSSVVYNNFPFPAFEEKEAVEELAEEVLRIRRLYPSTPLGKLYHPAHMPDDLKAAHEKLDRAVEALYGRSFSGEDDRVSFLLSLYGEMRAKMDGERRTDDTYPSGQIPR